MELHDWVTAALSAIAIAISIYALWLAQVTARKAAERERNKLWILETNVIENGHRAAFIKSGSQSIRYLSASAIAPPGLRIRKLGIRVNNKGRVYYSVPDAENASSVAVFAADDSAVGDDLSAGLILEMPSRPSWSQTAGASVRLVVRYEDVDAKRKRHEIDVWAHDVPWGRAT